MFPLCADQKIGVLPWSPLARGKLTRDWDEKTNRSEKDEFGKTLYTTEESDRAVAEAVRVIADAAACPAPRSPWHGPLQQRGQRADCRGEQADTSYRRRRFPGTDAHHRGKGGTGKPLRPARGRRILKRRREVTRRQHQPRDCGR